jgi:hypothetical protein
LLESKNIEMQNEQHYLDCLNVILNFRELIKAGEEIHTTSRFQCLAALSELAFNAGMAQNFGPQAINFAIYASIETAIAESQAPSSLCLKFQNFTIGPIKKNGRTYDEVRVDFGFKAVEHFLLQLPLNFSLPENLRAQFAQEYLEQNYWREMIGVVYKLVPPNVRSDIFRFLNRNNYVLMDVTLQELMSVFRSCDNPAYLIPFNLRANRTIIAQFVATVFPQYIDHFAGSPVARCGYLNARYELSGNCLGETRFGKELLRKLLKRSRELSIVTYLVRTLYVQISIAVLIFRPPKLPETSDSLSYDSDDSQ